MAGRDGKFIVAAILVAGAGVGAFSMLGSASASSSGCFQDRQYDLIEVTEWDPASSQPSDSEAIQAVVATSDDAVREVDPELGPYPGFDRDVAEAQASAFANLHRHERTDATSTWVNDEPGRRAEVQLLLMKEGWIVVAAHWELPSSVCENLQMVDRPDAGKPTDKGAAP